MKPLKIRAYERRMARPSNIQGWLMLCVGLSAISCSSSATGPSTDRVVQVQYHAKVEVTYVRDPGKVLNPDATAIPGFTYLLYDPDLRIKTATDKYLDKGYRIGTVIMEEIAENTFRGYIEQVPIHSAGLSVKHRIFAQDIKLHDGVNISSAYTPQGVTVQYAYDTSISGYELYFKIAQ